MREKEKDSRNVSVKVSSHSSLLSALSSLHRP